MLVIGVLAAALVSSLPVQFAAAKLLGAPMCIDLRLENKTDSAIDVVARLGTDVRGFRLPPRSSRRDRLIRSAGGDAALDVSFATADGSRAETSLYADPGSWLLEIERVEPGGVRERHLVAAFAGCLSPW